jgi:hypothetical protein
MADFILTDKQTETLKDKGWSVKPIGYHITVYSDDFTYSTWCEICKVAGENPDEIQELTLLAFGHMTK